MAFNSQEEALQGLKDQIAGSQGQYVSPEQKATDDAAALEALKRQSGYYDNPSVKPYTPPTSPAPTPTTINSEALAPTTPINYSTPQAVPIYNISKLNSDVTSTGQGTLTAPEKNVQDIINRLQGLNTSTIGKSAYQTQQEQAQGIPALQKTQTDLSSQLKAIQNEAQAIPLQLQTEATGRGITAGGLAPI